MSTPDIALCICTYNRYDLLPGAIRSAVEQSLPADRYEILVIDNSPDRNRAAAFAEKFATAPNLRYIHEKTPGLSNARNVAASQARAPVIAFMDDDALADPEWAAELLRAYESFGEGAMIVGGRVDPIWASPRPDWVHESMLGSLSIVNWGGEARVAGPDEWVAGTNISFRTSAIRDNGGFPLNLGRIGSGSALLSNEEIKLVERIRESGGQLIYAPRAVVNHLVDVRRLRRDWFRKRAAWQALSDFMMNPDGQAAEARGHWPELIKYFNALPPHERTIRGLLHPTDDPDLFHWQTGAVYMMTTLLLAGFEGVELD
ncbi:glycosyltransferase involved in cell wall biosynthesis [Rhodoblastus acidophilus]|uniref:glycosyltransferase n=1 Tax=Rhodoblastus acidophilus TaxID=1074 RepID=UPI002225472A|nr:glycosyltransferase family 2 protein [Rhodoblastus acidophilus]MCW2282994.1 glycosyltransferase involved in cell wall biosynthesis [Rhodoblastus acidophilus]MCW2331955.1 glycosyltransferase involved in cell wall biosynthesis [Rhodoblastus acidophilus]